MEIRRSYDRLISTVRFPILVRQHLSIESGPRLLQEFWQRSDECQGLKTCYTCGSTDVLFTFPHNQSCDQKCILGHTHLHKLSAFYDSLCTVVTEVFVLVTVWQIMWPWPCPMTLRIMTKSRSNWINWVRSGQCIYRVMWDEMQIKSQNTALNTHEQLYYHWNDVMNS